MTNQEVIELIENEIGCVTDADNGCDRDCGKCIRLRKSEDIKQAFGRAIEALEQEPELIANIVFDEDKMKEICKEAAEEIKTWLANQEPCMDAVSRKAIIEHYQVVDPVGKFVYCDSILEYILRLPSVQPQTVDWDAMIEEIDNEMASKKYNAKYSRIVELCFSRAIEIINKYRNGGSGY